MNNKYFWGAIIIVTLIASVIIGLTYLDKKQMGVSMFSQKSQLQNSNLQKGLNTGANLKISNGSYKWNVLKQTGFESNFDFWIKNSSEKKTEFGWILKAGNPTPTTQDQSLFNCDGTPILDDKNKPITGIKYETAKCDGNNCYHISLTDAQSKNIGDCFKFGNTSAIMEYQEDKEIQFCLDENCTKWIKDKILKNIDGNFTSEVNSLWVRSNNITFKAGADDNYTTGWDMYMHKHSSNLPLQYIDGRWYAVDGLNGVLIDFSEDCSKYNNKTNESANCQYNSYSINGTNYLETTFMSNGTIDPTYTISPVYTNAVLTNTTWEASNYTHLNTYDAYGDLVLDGTGDFVQVADSDSLDATTGLTLSAWVYGNNSAGNLKGIIAKSAGGSDWGAYSLNLVWIGTVGHARFTLNGASGDLASADVIPENTWTLVTATFSTTNGMQVYINGVTNGTSGYNTAITPTNSVLKVGNYYNTGNQFDFLGSIDDAMVYNRELNATEVANLYSAGRIGDNNNSNGRVLYQSYNGATANDYSGNGNNGALQGNAFVRGLVGYWAFDADRTKVYDLTPSGNDGTFQGVSNVSSVGKYGGSLQTSPSNYVTLDSANNLDITGASTVSAWVKFSSVGGNYHDAIFSKGTNAYFLTTVGEKCYAYYYTNTWNTLSGNTDIVDNNWHMCTMEYNGTAIRVFVDGKEDATPAALTGSVYVDTTQSKIGSYTGASSPAGSIDELMIWNRALTPDEINQTYQTIYPRFYPTGTIGLPNQIIIGGNNTLNITTTNQITPVLGSNLSVRAGLWQSTLGYQKPSSNVANITYGLVGHWAGDGNANDDLGLNNGTFIGNTNATSSGVYSTSFGFDGAGDWLNTTYTGDFKTVSLWYNAITSMPNVWNGIFVQSTNDDDGIQIRRWNNANYGGVKIGSTDYEMTSIVFDNTWRNVVVTKDATKTYVYVNGVLVSTINAVWTTAGNVKIGIKGSVDYGFDGYIDEVIVLNRTLSANEIKSIYNQGIANWNYTAYQNVTSGVDNQFSMPTTTTNILSQYQLVASNSSFYTSYFNHTAPITLTTWDFTGTPTNTCTCPSINTNWVISLSDYCVISSPCNIGTGNITWTNSGNITFNAQINAKNIAGLPAGSRGYITQNGKVYVG